MIPNNPYQPFAEKYRASSFSSLVGQDTAIATIKEFIQNFPKTKKRALLLHGPAGTGKTSLALAAAKEFDLEVLELNASDLRNRAQLEERLKPASQNQSLFKNKGKLLLMDEVDGVTGSDRGGIPELVRLIKETKHPIIMTCNDVWQSKLSPVRSQSQLIELRPLSTATIAALLTKVSLQESIKENQHFLNQIAIKSQGDLRAALNDLQAYASGDNPLDPETDEKRDVEESIFNILKKIFKDRDDVRNLFDSSSLSLDEILLWIEENTPREYHNETLAKAMMALANADRFRGRIYKNQSWRFLVYQNLFQSNGISFAKPTPLEGFTKYERPKRILKIWLNNQKIAKKKTLAQKLARHTHTNTKRALKDINLLKPVLQQQTVQEQLRLSDDEVAFLEK
jgi:replication factor C large subunit